MKPGGSLVISTPPELLDLIRRSNLLEELQMPQAEALASQSSSAVALAKALVSARLITRWQAQQLLAGRFTFILNKYRLLEKVGDGGMGSVYKAEQLNSGRVVALKVLSKKLVDNPAHVARFSREVQAAAALNHPNIVTAFDAGHEGKVHFLVMEYVDARDLRHWMRHYGKLPIDWSCEVIMQTARGLQHACERGLVHRDIKPANLLVSAVPGEPPQVKILDMGLARAIDDADDELTLTGQVLGTPDYMAPEQARSTRTVDIRADIFGLGVTLFKMLGDALPFSGGNAFEKLMARTTEDPPSVREFRPDVSPRLESIVAKMLARDPEHRYQTPGEVAEALAPLALSTKGEPDDDSDIHLTAITETGELSPEADPRLADFFSHLGMPETADTPASNPPSDSGSSLSDVVLESRWVWGSAAAGVGVLILLVMLLALSSGPAAKTAEGDFETQRVEIIPAVALEPQTPVKSNDPLRDPHLVGHSGKVTGLCITPDGRRLISSSLDNQVKVWSLESYAEEFPLNGHEDDVLAVACRPDGLEVVSAGEDRVLRLWTLGRQALRLRMEGHGADVNCVSYSPDGSLVASGASNGILRVWMTATGSLKWKQNFDRRVLAVAFSRQGRSLAVGLSDGSIPVLDLETGNRRFTLTGHEDDVLALAFRPQGDLLASGSKDTTAALWDLGRRERKHRLNVKLGWVPAVAFSPDGTLLATGTRGLILWNVETGNQMASLTPHRTGQWAVAFTPDGLQVASGGEDKSITLFDVPLGLSSSE